jgi:hypothetical protein
VITSPGRIRIRLKVERARAREEQLTRDGSTKILKNTKEVSVVELGRSSDKLTQNVNNMRNVRTSAN